MHLPAGRMSHFCPDRMRHAQLQQQQLSSVAASQRGSSLASDCKGSKKSCCTAHGRRLISMATTPEVIEIPLPQLQVPTTGNSAPPLMPATPSLVPPPPNLLASFSSAPPANANQAVPQKAVAVQVVPDPVQKSASDGATSADPVPSADAEPSATFMDLFRFASAGDKVMVGFAFFLAVLHGACLPAFSYVFGEFMDTTGSVSPDELLDRVSFLAGIMVAIGAFAFVASGLWTALFAYSSQRQGARIRTIYLASIIGKDCAWFDSVTPAEIPTRMNEEISRIQRAIGHQLGTGTMNASMFILGVLLGLVRGWQVALIVCSAMPLIGLSSGALGFFMSQKDKVQMDAYASSGAVAEEVIYSIRTVTAFGGQVKEFARYCSKLSEAKAAGVRSGFLLACSLGLVYMFFYWGYAIAFWFGGKLISEDVKNSFTNKVWTGGDVVIVFFSVIMGLFGVGQVFPAVDAVRSGRAAASRVYPILKLPSTIEPMLQDTSDIDPTLLPASFPTVDLTPEAAAAIGAVKSLSLNNVTFCYPARPGVTVLDGVSINLNIGQKIAFVGSSGSGKSTIISLLMRFYDPQSGCVLLNGIDVRAMPVMQLRRVFGYVGQEPVVFGMSVRQNLLYGFPDASGYTPSPTDIENACARAQVLQFISSLPLQFDTLCGSGGSQISGGQKQRIAIARALLRRPQILLLDEATSALDNESEALVQQTIDSLGDISTISVAHRLSTIRNSDKIFVMHTGRVVEQGNHEELMAIPSGSYANLVHLQSAMAEAGSDPASTKTSTKVPTAAAAAAAKAKSSPLVTSQKSPADADGTSKVDDEDEAAATKKRQEEIGKAYKVPFSRLMSLADGEKIWFIPGIIGAAMQGSNMPLSGVFMADTLAYFYNPDKAAMEAGVYRYALWFVLLGVGTCIGTILSSGSFKRIEHVLVMNVRSLCFEKFMHQDISFFDDPAHSPGKLTGALSTWSLKMSPLAGSTMGLQLQALAAIIIGLSFAFASSWKLSLVMLSTIPCMGLGAALNAVVMLGGEFDEKKDVAESQLIASEAVQNIRTLRSCGAQAWVLRNYTAASVGPLARRRTMAIKQGISFGVSQGMLFPCYGLGFWYGTKLMIDDGLPYADMLKAILCVIFAAWGMGEALGFMPDINEAKTAAHDVFELLDAPCGIDPISVPAGAVQGDGDGSITFNNVHFAYPQRPDVPILQGLSFHVKKGQKVALVGPSGGGKSTVIALLERFYDPAQGSIVIGGGHELNKMDVTWWRQQIGYVGQEPVMFDLTLADNVKYGCSSAPAETDLADVAKASNMDFIGSGTNNSLQWNSPLGPRGGLLSGGQKQRAAIARAQLRKPRIMLFDEATSALDSNSEKLVQAALERSMVGRTSFTIAHRLSTIVDSDVILVIAQGRLVEQGSHAELMQIRGVYYSQFMQGQGAA